MHNSHYEKFADGKVVCIDEEIPFDVPQGWSLARFGSIMFNRDNERIPLSVSERCHLAKNYDYYGASGVIDKVDRYLFDKPLLLIGEDGANLINRSTPIAFIAKGKYWVNNHAHVLDCINEVFMRYICLYINSISLVDYVTGTAQPKMNQEKMNSILVLIPPYQEQQRILEKVDSILPIVKQYATNQEKLNTLNKDINIYLRKSILQEAIQGKLVSQNPSDEPASVLLERIKEEKLRLVKEGKLKKKDVIDSVIYKGDDNRYYEKNGKNEVDITEEIPFEIPQSWEWVRLKSVARKIVDGDHNPPHGLPSNSGYYMLSSKNINNDSIDKLDDVRYLSFEDWKMCHERTNLQKGDILLTTVATLGRSCVYKDDVPFCFQRSVSVISTFICNYYLKYCFDSPYFQSLINDNATGTAQRGFYLNQLEKTIIPLPPYEEQKRIVAKIELLQQVL